MQQDCRFKAKSVPRGRALLLPAALLAACTGAPDPAGPPPPEVTVATPLQREVTDWDPYTARLDAVQVVEVRARVSGYLESVNFEEGAILNEGDLLYVIDPRPYEAEHDRSQAEADRAEARVRLAESQLERAQRLFKSKTIAEEELDSRTEERREASATLQAARAAVEQARLDVEFTHIRAPIAGRIGRTLVTPGNLVSGGNENSTLLTTIVSLDPIYAYLTADEQAYLRYMRLDQAGERPSSRQVHNPVRLRLADEKEFSREGYMDFVDNRIDPGTGTLMGRAVFSNSDHTLVPGMFAELQLLGRGPYSALLIPDEAVVFDQAQKLVFVLDADNVAQRRFVETGRLHFGLRVVASGLSPGDRIVINGVQRVRAGDPVKPVTGTIEEKSAP